jgi:tetratricopeptide (TPR) repeat protein
MYKIILAVLLILPAVRHSAAQSAPAPAGEQQAFLRLLSDVRENPEDDAAREKLLLYVRGMRGKPPIPVEAKKYYIRAMAAQLDAVNDDDFDKVARTYDNALELAPWWGQCYFNRSKALEAAKRFEEAEEAMRFYKLLDVPGSRAVKKTAPAAPQPAPPATGPKPDFRGTWGNGMDCWRYEFAVRGSQLVIKMRCWDFSGAVYGTATLNGRHFEGSSPGGASGTGVGVRVPIRFKGEISEDNDTIEISIILAPELAETAAAQAAAMDQERIYGDSIWQNQTWRHMGVD